MSADNEVPSGIWSFCEIAVGIVAACLPTLAVLVSQTRLSFASRSALTRISNTFRWRSRGSRGGLSSNPTSKAASDGTVYFEMSASPNPSQK